LGFFMTKTLNVQTERRGNIYFCLIPGGRQKVKEENPEMYELEIIFNDVDIGGHWTPKSCIASKKLAIIIPVRDRFLHLRKLLYNLIPKLQRQLLDFTIYVVEQVSRFM